MQENVRDQHATVAVVCAESMWEHAFTWLLGSTGIRVVAHARDIDRAPDIVKRAAPDVLVVDVDAELEPPRLLSRLREVRHLRPSTHVVVVCEARDSAMRDAALAGGASRVTPRKDAIRLLRAVEDARTDGDCDEDGRTRLTLRELEILRLVAGGRTNREVARAAWVSEQTVKYHLANIYRRLGVSSRHGAVAWAKQNGVVDDQPTGRSISRP